MKIWMKEQDAYFLLHLLSCFWCQIFSYSNGISLCIYLLNLDTVKNIIGKNYTNEHLNIMQLLKIDFVNLYMYINRPENWRNF